MNETVICSVFEKTSVGKFELLRIEKMNLAIDKDDIQPILTSARLRHPMSVVEIVEDGFKKEALTFNLTDKIGRELHYVFRLTKESLLRMLTSTNKEALELALFWTKEIKE